MDIKLKETIKNIFYGEVILECSNGNLQIGENFPAICFDTKIDRDNNVKEDEINPKPVLVIKDKKRFDEALYAYAIKAIEFYYENNFSHDNIKSVLAYVFSNATSLDLSNPIPFIKHRTLLLNNNLEDNIEREFLGYKGIIEIKKQKPFLETPYAFKYTIYDEEHNYVLPYIMYGISNDTAYVYAIQNKFNDFNGLRKKLNRTLFKLNNGFNDISDSDIFNGNDVSMSFVASLLVFISYLNGIGITKIKVPVNLPIRYNAHYESYNRRLNYHKKVLNDVDFEDYKKKLDKSNDSYDDNVVMKLIRTFYRVSMQGDVLKINYLPFSVGSEMDISINLEGTFNNDLCNEIYGDSKKVK